MFTSFVALRRGWRQRIAVRRVQTVALNLGMGNDEIPHRGVGMKRLKAIYIVLESQILVSERLV